MSQQMASIKIANQENVLPVNKCVLEEIKSNQVIDITISYVSIVDIIIFYFKPWLFNFIGF